MLPAALVLVALSPAHAMNCMPLGAGGLAIGHYQPLDPAPLDAQASMAIDCSPATPGEALNLEVRLLNAGTGRVQLQNVQGMAPGGGTLAVQLYRDAARTLPLDEQATLRFTDRPLMPTRYWVSVYARVPARQDVETGQYRLPLTLLITY